MPKHTRFIAPTKRDENKHPKSLSVIVPVAGIGYRMKSYGPKCLLKISENHSIISRLIDNINTVFSKEEIIVCVGFEADRVMQNLPASVRVVENQKYEDTNTTESLRLSLNNSVSDSVLIIHGDLVFNPVTIQCFDRTQSSVIVDSIGQIRDDETGVTIVNEEAMFFAYGLSCKWGQIAYFVGKELNLLKKVCSDRNKSKMYTFEILNEIIQLGGRFKSIEPRNMKIYEVDGLKDLR
jgi:choline kinase